MAAANGREASTPYRAAAFTAFSVVLAALCPVLLGYPYLSFPWFTCLGMVLLSFSRFHGVRHGVPCPELLYLASSYLGWAYFALLLPSSRILSVDEILWRFDVNFGYPEVPLARFFLNHHVANAVIRLAYLGLPLAGVIVYLALPNSTLIRRQYCVASGLGALVLLFYGICPAAGPLYLFHDRFPYAAPVLDHPHLTIIPSVSLNCAPSGHVAWALILLWFGRRYCGGIVRAGTVAFLIATCLGTLGLGEHYVIDLVLAVPFATGLWALTGGKWRHAGISGMALLVWLVALREGWVLDLPRAAVWTLCAVTLSAPWWGEAMWALRQRMRPVCGGSSTGPGADMAPQLSAPRP
jgi:hypothetical protein